MSANATSLSSWRRRVRPRAVVLGVILVAATSAAGPARAETVLLMPGTGAGVSSTIILSARKLLLERLVARNPSVVFLDMDRQPIPTAVPAPYAVKEAHARDARSVILFDLRRAEPTTVLRVTGYTAPEGERLFVFEESTDAGPEALPDMVERAAHAALPHKPKAPEPRSYFIGARAGVVVPFGTAGKETKALASAGVHLVKELSSAFLEIGVEIAGSAPAYRNGFGLGCYFTASERIYLGASLRWQWIKVGGRAANGLTTTPTLGTMLRVTSGLTLRAEAGYFVDLFEEKERDRLAPGSGQAHRSYGPQVSVGGWF